ncbi:phosphatase PAP2 family protein [Streptomyces sp. NBC_01216]|uniref:phosphatase PAP2 family protein n=1 Tax=Streptomyces sp. NBC_01216 TaxID=2903778 RepID=UPI002E1081D8|nr:phosphatase PAP2 family protein [Streptomyces sp. NBC_01216]
MRFSAVLSGALALLLLALVAVGWSPLVSLDRSVGEALHRSAVVMPGFTHANRILTDWVWDPWTMRGLIAVAVVVLWWRGERRLALWPAVTTVFAAGLEQGLKAAVGRPRPNWPDPVDSAHYASFPSGHAMTATVCCGLLLWVLALHWRDAWRGWGAVAVTAVMSVLGVGWTRVYLGVHWPSDVVAGWLLGWTCVAVAILLHRRTTPEGARRRMGETA